VSIGAANRTCDARHANCVAGWQLKLASSTAPPIARQSSHCSYRVAWSAPTGAPPNPTRCRRGRGRPPCIGIRCSRAPPERARLTRIVKIKVPAMSGPPSVRWPGSPPAMSLGHLVGHGVGSMPAGLHEHASAVSPAGCASARSSVAARPDVNRHPSQRSTLPGGTVTPHAGCPRASHARPAAPAVRASFGFGLRRRGTPQWERWCSSSRPRSTSSPSASRWS
jgi:hypothetical protein